MQRLRITFAKTAAMQYTGHLDLHKSWERTLRRARLPLAYSEGFNPHPKIQLAAALPLGFTSSCEIVDLWLESPQLLGPAREALVKAAPPGIVIDDVKEIPASSPAVQTLVTAVEYRVTLPGAAGVSDVESRVAALLRAPSLRRTRRDKEYDLRPLIESLAVGNPAPDGLLLVTRLAAREGATGRPEEVVDALGWPTTSAAYHRQQIFLVDG